MLAAVRPENVRERRPETYAVDVLANDVDALKDGLVHQPPHLVVGGARDAADVGERQTRLRWCVGSAGVRRPSARVIRQAGPSALTASVSRSMMP